MATDEHDDDDDGGGGIPEWVVTFGDMMSLLLTFFIMLVSLSEIKEDEKYQALVDSMQRRFGYDSSMSSLVPGTARPRNSEMSRLATTGRSRRLDVMKGGEKTPAPVGDFTRVRNIRPGNITGLGTTIYFEGDSAELTDDHRDRLTQLSQLIGGKPQRIEIRGHTTRRPPSADSGFDDHWDLAYQRCRNTFEYLVQDMQIDPLRLRISVSGPNEPISISSERDKYELNSRVEVSVLDEVVSDFTGTREEQERRFTEQGG